MPYTRRFTLKTPAPVSSVLLETNKLAVGSDDGSLRLFDLPSSKVTKAIRGLGSDVSSIAWLNGTSNEQKAGEIWVASGTTAYAFTLDTTKMILSKEDASVQLQLGQGDDDVLNELAVSDSHKHVAFSTDAGSVGIVELASGTVSHMKLSHTNICSSVKFIPDRPSELVSGGYDSAILHFDFKQGNLLSRFDIAAAPPTSGVSLSPPFILSVSTSRSGIVAATTADGRIWLGTGADKSSPAVSKKKRSRKWEGLREDRGVFVQVADGPIVASTFIGPTTLVSCTLLGKITVHSVTYDDAHDPQLTTVWAAEVTDLAKVNTLDASEEWLVVGGFSEDGKGGAEVWRLAAHESSGP